METEQLAIIKVLVAEDSPMTRLGIVTMLSTESDMEVVAEASDGEEAVRLFRQHAPQVVLTDLKMPALDGVHVTRTICAQQPDARVLILTNYDGDETIFQALKAGAAGYLTKGVSGTELVAAVRAVARGDRYFPPSVASRLAERVLIPALTPREVQVIEHIYAGLTNVEIAAALGISRKTVSMFVSKVLAKLDVRTRTEAVGVAIERGILRPRPKRTHMGI